MPRKVSCYQNLPVSTINFPSPSVKVGTLGRDLVSPYPKPDGALMVPISRKFYAGYHSCSAFTRAITVFCPENNASQDSSISGSHLFLSLCKMFSDSLKGWHGCPFMAKISQSLNLHTFISCDPLSTSAKRWSLRAALSMGINMSV